MTPDTTTAAAAHGDTGGHVGRVVLPCVGIDATALGSTPRGELYRIDFHLDDADALSAQTVAQCLGFRDPLVIGPRQFVAVLEHGADSQVAVALEPGKAGNLNLHANPPVQPAPPVCKADQYAGGAPAAGAPLDPHWVGGAPSSPRLEQDEYGRVSADGDLVLDPVSKPVWIRVVKIGGPTPDVLLCVEVDGAKSAMRLEPMTRDWLVAELMRPTRGGKVPA